MIEQNSRRTIWVKSGRYPTIQIIDQRFLPHRFVVQELKTLDDVVCAISEMRVRGAPLIGVTAAFGLYLAMRQAPQRGSCDAFLVRAGRQLLATRPTAVNLAWAIDRQLRVAHCVQSREEKLRALFNSACEIAEEDVSLCKRIGEHGLKIIERIAKRKRGKPVQILTHCNAGWLACVEWGTATSPIYHAFERGIPIHVWVDETRPRNQGASLTAWELSERGVPHTVIADNAGGHLMQHRMVDVVFVGADRVTRTVDAANKIGTYLKALAARDNKVPFYVAAPSSSIDWKLRDGISEIPIEERSPDEVHYISGLCCGKIESVRVTPQTSQAKNFGFDVTPARLITGLITERGIAQASQQSLLRLFPEKK